MIIRYIDRYVGLADGNVLFASSGFDSRLTYDTIDGVILDSHGKEGDVTNPLYVEFQYTKEQTQRISFQLNPSISVSYIDLVYMLARLQLPGKIIIHPAIHEVHGFIPILPKDFF